MHYHEKDLEIAKEVEDKAGEARAYGNLGNSYRRVGNCEKTIEEQKLNLKIAEEVKNRAGQGQACGCLGDAYYRLGDVKQAIKYCNLQLSIAKEVGSKEEEGRACHTLGCCFESLGSMQEALSYHHSSVQLFNQVRCLLQSKDDWKISLRNQIQDAYTGVWRVLVKLGKTNLALSSAEQGRAQSLTDLMVSNYGLSPDQSLPNDRQEITCDTLDHYMTPQAVFIALDENSINVWMMCERKELAFKRTEIDDGYLLDENAITFMSRLNQDVFEEIGVAGDDAEELSLVTLTSETTPAQRQKEKSLRMYHDLVLGSIEGLVQGGELIIVPDGPLCLAPFVAFVDSTSRYLCETFKIRIAPSLTSLKLIRDCPDDSRAFSSADVLLVGNPCAARNTS